MWKSPKLGTCDPGQFEILWHGMDLLLGSPGDGTTTLPQQSCTPAQVNNPPP